MDEAVPTYVKAQYSPRESWKGKPFSKEDARFFFKGVNELSLLFTEERSRRAPAYFQHPRFRSSYLLYFLPLQAAKFVTLFQLHSGALKAAFDHARKTGVLRVLDLGAGPGTASLALLLTLLDPPDTLRAEARDFKVELHWWDTDSAIMEDGKALVETLSSNFPALRGRVTAHTHVGPFWTGMLQDQVGGDGEYSLVLMGNVLNESAGPSSDPASPQSMRAWSTLLAKAEGGGVLFVEPAIRRSSQLLSRIRDHLIESELLEREQAAIWGPCLHAGACPLSEGRDWCHFSIPVQIPGNWFRDFSTGLGSERSWVKFSYLWVASKDFPAPEVSRSARRVISDPLSKQSTVSEVLVCEPGTPGRARIPASKRVHRGDIVR